MNSISYRYLILFSVSPSIGQTDRQTDGQPDRQTDRETNKVEQRINSECKLKCSVKSMKDALGVSPSKGNQGTTRGKEKILLTSAGIKPTTSGLDLPLACRLSYEVRQRKSGNFGGGGGGCSDNDFQAAGESLPGRGKALFTTIVLSHNLRWVVLHRILLMLWQLPLCDSCMCRLIATHRALKVQIKYLI